MTTPKEQMMRLDGPSIWYLCRRGVGLTLCLIVAERALAAWLIAYRWDLTAETMDRLAGCDLCCWSTDPEFDLWFVHCWYGQAIALLSLVLGAHTLRRRVGNWSVVLAVLTSLVLAYGYGLSLWYHTAVGNWPDRETVVEFWGLDAVAACVAGYLLTTPRPTKRAKVG